MNAKKLKVVPEDRRCSHIFRSGPLHPSIKIGGASLGQCPNERFPELVVCYEHADKSALALLAKSAVKAADERLFLLLFYRERLGRLSQRLESQEGAKAALRKRHRKNTLSEWDLNPAQIGKFLMDFVRRAEDDTRCNDLCKSMYFCDRKKGHTGKHGEWCGPEPVPAKVGPGWLCW